MNWSRISPGEQKLRPMWLPWGDLVSPLPFSSVFVVLSDLGFWVCGDAGLQRFGSPLYDSSCLQAACGKHQSQSVA